MAERRKKRAPSRPPIVYAEASVRSVGEASLFDQPEPVTSENVQNFYSESQLTNSAADKLRAQGFDVLHVGETTISIAGPPRLYERVFRSRIVTEERKVIKEFGRATTATFLDSPDTGISGLIDPAKSSLADVIEGVALNEPVYYFASAFAPPKSYWHLDVPAGVSLGMNADRAHRFGVTGRGVKVVMADSGWYRHPYFTQRGYRASGTVLGPAATDPATDANGHGTGESANVFAVAPDVNFTMVKMNFVNSIGAFKAAVGLKPDIISCSWGSSVKFGPLSAANQALAAAIASAVRQGIVVVFSAGNGHFGFPGQHPDVISAGGTFMHEDGSMEASDYASGFSSNVYPKRIVPDVCGLVGMKPGATYIMLPVEPGDAIDVGRAGGTHPPGDETSRKDGWAAFSGTSAAAPQLAGVSALLKQVCPGLTPVALREILKKTARDVTTGVSNSSSGGHPATPGVDLATGHGLADAFRATLIAWFRCLSTRRAGGAEEAILEQPGLEIGGDAETLEDMLLAVSE